MTYKIYKKKLSKKEYFKVWDSENYKKLTEEFEKQIYEKYLIKCEIFQRDNFTCQNENCKFCNNVKFHSSLTMHHIKWQKNKGMNKIRNGVTLCYTIHQGFHKGKHELKFSNIESLPSHIRGHTFKFSSKHKVDWKKVKREMKELRKNLKNVCGLKLSWEELHLLMAFLEVNFNVDDD